MSKTNFINDRGPARTLKECRAKAKAGDSIFQYDACGLWRIIEILDSGYTTAWVRGEKSMRAATYKCDIWLEFPDKPGHMMLDQLFSINADSPDTAEAIREQAYPFYKKHAGANKVTLSSYRLEVMQ